MNFISVVGLFVFMLTALCDICADDMIPFSGFKIAQTYLISFMPFASRSFLVVTHCRRGRSHFVKEFPIECSPKSLFNNTFCFIDEPHETGEGVVSTMQVTRMKFLDKVLDKTKMAMKKVLQPLRSLKLRLSRKPSIATKKAPESDMSYSISALNNGSSLDINKTSSALSLANIVCHKMARRRSYALTDLVFFVPYTFIGGSFRCNLTHDQRDTVLEDLTPGQVTAHPFKCDKDLATPFRPMVADLSGRSKVTWSVSPLSVLHTIPFLKSVSRLDPRFSLPETIGPASWAASIDVNENYTYSAHEIRLFNVASTKVMAYIRKIVDPPKLGLSKWISGFFPLNETRYDSLAEPASKFAIFLSSLNESAVLIHQNYIQLLWRAARLP